MVCTYPLRSAPATKQRNKVAPPSLTTFRHSWLWESFLNPFLPELETVSDLAWMALAWHTGVLEHQPGMLKKHLCSDVCDGSPFYSTTSVQKKCPLVHCLGPGRRSHETSPEQAPITFTLLLSSSDMAHDLLHSHMSAEKNASLYHKLCTDDGIGFGLWRSVSPFDRHISLLVVGT